MNINNNLNIKGLYLSKEEETKPEKETFDYLDEIYNNIFMNIQK